MNTLNGTEPEPIDGLTPAQRFYLSYATVWAQNIRDEEIARLTKLDVHFAYGLAQGAVGNGHGTLPAGAGLLFA